MELRAVKAQQCRTIWQVSRRLVKVCCDLQCPLGPTSPAQILKRLFALSICREMTHLASGGATQRADSNV